MTDFCILCANGNDLPEGEYCRGCAREGRAFGLGAAVIKARGRQEPPTVPVAFDGCSCCGSPYHFRLECAFLKL